MSFLVAREVSEYSFVQTNLVSPQNDEIYFIIRPVVYIWGFPCQVPKLYRTRWSRDDLLHCAPRRPISGVTVPHGSDKLLGCAPTSPPLKAPHGSRKSSALIWRQTTPRSPTPGLHPPSWSRVTRRVGSLAVWPGLALSRHGPRTTRSVATPTTPAAKPPQKNPATAPRGGSGSLAWCWSTTSMSPATSLARPCAGRSLWPVAIRSASPACGTAGQTQPRVSGW